MAKGEVHLLENAGQPSHFLTNAIIRNLGTGPMLARLQRTLERAASGNFATGRTEEERNDGGWDSWQSWCRSLEQAAPPITAQNTVKTRILDARATRPGRIFSFCPCGNAAP
ncbi:hypothetical protein FOPE_10883 [Fonsecaea pedrosoi]|nr:hypothetical protein FOPE_10883 [Fonsecaea pedrosoi]